ncbi:MAG: DUF4388 domain-containing protein, partial [Alphaproteobacteria bacterium]
AELPFARVLTLAGRRGRGRLRLEHRSQWVEIWVAEKQVVGLSSAYLPGASFGEMLVKKDRISRYALEAAQQEMDVGRRLGEWLISQSLLDQAELEELLAEHVLEKTTVAFSWRWYDGSWSYWPQEGPDNAQVLADLDLREAVFAGIGRHYDLDRLEMIFSKRERLRRALIPTTPYLDDLPVAARRLLRAADGRSSAISVRLRAGMEVRRYYQTLYALLVLDLIRFGDPVQGEELQRLLNEELFHEGDHRIEDSRK